MRRHVFYNAFGLIEKIGPARMKKLINFFGDPASAWKADQADFKRAGLEESVVESLIHQRAELDPEREFQKLEEHGIRIISLEDEEYPSLLKETYNPPFALYVKGKIRSENINVAIVGSRKVTPYGRQVAQVLARDLAGAGLTIVSGMAAGIDTIAHTESLKAGQETIAVLGNGLDVQNIYPPMNRKLAEEIANSGAVISEYPIGTPPLRFHFPARNRIISGLSVGVIIVEATEGSGALITAKHALEQNKEIFAVPGSIFSESSVGTNNLIKSGAHLTTSANEVLEELNLTLATDFIKNRKVVPDSAEEKIILDNLSKEPIHIDKLAEKAQLSTSEITATLTLMEMKGKVRNMGGMMFVIS